LSSSLIRSALSHDEYQIPSQYTGGDPIFYREWRVTQNFRYSFLINKRWRNLGFRLGVKESSGGGGVSWYTANDRFQVHADAFDWTYGIYPAVSDDQALGFNTRLLLRYEPMKGMFVEAGTENIAPGLRYGYFTGFVGAGLHFTDNDIKLLLATLPIGR
jgi:hypothetical protein